jgi:hypothetical protein
MIFTLLGWTIGVATGLALGSAILISFAISLPPLLLSIISGLPALPFTIAPAVAIIVLVAFYVLAYAIATLSLTAVLPPFTPPLTLQVATPAGVSVRVGAAPGELFARGLLIGATAILNAMGAILWPGSPGAFLSVWCFTVISLAIITPVARSPFYHGFLGWSAWLFPMSYIATAIGLLLFIVNAPFAFAAAGIAAFRLDFSTGVIETTGGITGITGFGSGLPPGGAAGFSLGNFNFLVTGSAQDSFLLRNVSSHETGHTLNTAALGGVVLWINAIDENVPPLAKLNMAYGELTAESHAQGLPPDVIARVDFFVGIWG